MPRYKISEDGQVVERKDFATFDSTGDLLSTTGIPETPWYVNKNAQMSVTFDKIEYIARAAAAGDNANNFTVVIRRRDAAGGGPVVVVAYTNNVASGGVAAFVLKDLGMLANATLSPGQSLTIEVQKNGLGQNFPAGQIIGSFD